MLTIMSLTLSSCARMCTGINRSLQMTNRNYKVTMYSGGKKVKTYKFHGIINNQESSDGYFFYINDTLVEVSGDVIIESYK